MAQNYAKLSGRGTRPTRVNTPQTEPIKGRENDMTVNPAGAYSFKADDWARLDRFLIIGVTGNSLYQSQKTLVTENADHISALLVKDGIRTIDAAITVLEDSRAMKVDSALFVLAMASSVEDKAVRAHALASLPRVIRIPTHLFTYVEYVNSMRGWGRALRRAVGNYYTNTGTSKLAMHAWKYKSRNGWSHRDVLRLAHANTEDEVRNAVIRYMARGELPAIDSADTALAQIHAAEELLHLGDGDAKTAVRLIRDHRLTREAVPTGLLNSTKVWEALLEEMPIGAMVRNLGKMSSLGMTGAISDVEKLIVSRLLDEDRIINSRIHPMNLLIAMKTYENGRGVKGSLAWRVNNNIVDALDDAFYTSFVNVERTGKRILVAGDDSGSMTWRKTVSGVMTPAEVAAAMMLITYKTEPNAVMIRYNSVAEDVLASRKSTVTQLLKEFGRGGSTNTAAPLHYAIDRKMDFDAIVSYTDNVTWSGSNYWGGRNGHVTEKLRDYQNKVGHPVRFMNVSMESNAVSDVDPSNPNMLELTGFDTSTPRVIGEFIAGRV